MKNKKTIFLGITHGWHARMLLRTSFIDNLKKGNDYNIVVLSENADEVEFQREFGNDLIYKKISNQGGFLWTFTNHIRRNLSLDSRLTKTIKLRIEATKSSRPISYIIIKILNKLFSISLLAVKVVRVLDHILFPDKNYKSIFKEFEPDLLVISSVVHNQGYYLLRCASSLGVKSLFIVESWDNPTCKVNFFDYPNKYIVWNEFNRQELAYYCNIDENDIMLTGSSYHDIYARKESFCSKEEFVKRYGLNINKKIITIAATMHELYPEFDLFIEELYKKCNNNYFGENCQILIRPHPQTITGYSLGKTKDDLNDYKIKYPNIFFDVPKIVSKVLPVDIHAGDILRLAEILYHSDLVISFLSSVTIDSCALDKPVIITGFNYDKNLSNKPTLRDRLNYIHHKKIISSGGIKVAYNFNDLNKYITMYLNDPSIDKMNRLKLVEEQCYKVDGKSSERMANSIREYINTI